ncbi:amidase [Hyphomonas sp.]|uniref:amidase n=1 Tax=Hyphomonas sp. TaxID=87 RepID=UPI00391A885E
MSEPTESGATRRSFLKIGGAAAAGVAGAAACTRPVAAGTPSPPCPALAGAEQIAGITYTEAQRAQMEGALEQQLIAAQALRAAEKPNSLAPATVFDPRLPGKAYPLAAAETRVSVPAPPLGAKPSEDDVAFATIPQLGAWLRSRVVTCAYVTEAFLSRIARLDPLLFAYITVMPDRARAEAAALDAEIARGHWRGPLHGIPYGLKDLFDADGAPVTWGAEPYRDEQPKGDAAIVRRLKEAGAVLLGKTSCGALAYGDIWFGGTTRNPFDPRESSSGSSAGSASAVAAGLCAFAIGTETLGSLVSPSMRCGTTALRPTFGRVSRAGGMALCWSLDKVGPMTRSVADCALVMAAINGFDADDAGSIETGFAFESGKGVAGLRLGYDPAWLEAATPVEKQAMEAALALGAELQEFRLPDLPAGQFMLQLMAEAAAAFEDLTLSGRDAELSWQDDVAWPNSFRAARFISAIDLINADRIRRQWMEALDAAFAPVDVVIGPSFSAGLLAPTNFTGHPCLAMRAGFQETRPRSIFDVEAEPEAEPARTPVAISLWAPLFGESAMLTFGEKLEGALGVANERPAI